jgi:hypothetical protein
MPKDEKGREIPSRFFAEDGSMRFFDATPLTEEDLAELKQMKKMMDQGGKK